jgi:superfamily II DNA or RNA helicase|tara:strand:+ start:177 stop:1592 length:1416 start_codon:yes stop_codon:yes gene_type:complete
MKLTKSGYTIVKSDLPTSMVKEIKDELFVKPFTFNKNANKESGFRVYMESPKKLYIPRFYGLKKFGNPAIDKMEGGDDIVVNFKGDLREEQKPIEELYIKNAREKGGGIISIRCGGGKTVLGLHITSVLKKKTLVIVHKDFLMTQWRDRIIEFLPDAKIGKIQQDTVDIEGKDIVLAMVQSLSMKEYKEGTFDSFGLVIFDECHHLGAEVFSKCMAKVASKYMLGLSATPKRKDGLSKVFEWYIGDIVYLQEKKNEDYAEVQLIDCLFQDKEYNKEEVNFRKEPCMPRMINNICNYVPRTEQIIELTLKYRKEGRHILILTDRRAHLELIHTLLEGHSRGFYVGGMKPDQLRESQGKDIILATFSMAAEGMDIPILDTVILASPKSDVEQSVGRIFRKKACDREFHPLIIDIQDNFSMFQKQCDKRLKLYKQMSFTIFHNGEEMKKRKAKATGKAKAKQKVIEFSLIDDED